MKLVTTTTDTLQANQDLGISGVNKIRMDTWGNVIARSENGASVSLYSSVEAVSEGVAEYVSDLQYCSGERATEALAILERIQAKLTESRALLRDRETV